MKPSPFTRAIVRTPSSTFADGLTTSDLGPPDLARALEQHDAYVEALRTCGLEVTVLPPDPRFPDSTFVEDTAVITAGAAFLARPGAPSRTAEIEAIRDVLTAHLGPLRECAPPGTLDGGDICEIGSHVLIGLSHRTNEPGAAQLAEWLASRGRTSATIDIRPIDGLLHLKTAIAALDASTVVVAGALASHPALAEYSLIHVAPEEAYAANCVHVNDRVLLARGFPKLESALRDAGFSPLLLDMSEFQKMDGGLSCLSLRYG